LSYPLGKNADQAVLARSELERDQAKVALRSAEYKAVREIRLAALQLDQNRQRIETTRVARELSEQRLDAEQKRYEVGMSTNFNVIQAQRDLAIARNGELQAQLDYQLALIAFDTVQKVGTSASGGVTAPALTPNTTSTTTTTTAAAPTGPGGGVQ
jgi:outer membrane protein TolC